MSLDPENEGIVESNTKYHKKYKYYQEYPKKNHENPCGDPVSNIFLKTLLIMYAFAFITLIAVFAHKLIAP